MEQPLLSKISIGTGADNSHDTEAYDPIISWNKIIEKQFGELAPYMKIFASHSQHLEMNWDKTGPYDDPEFYEKAHQAVLDTKEGKIFDFTELNEMINKMINAAETLFNKLPNDILNESQLMLGQFKRIANADLVAMKSLKNNKLDSELKKLRQEIKNNENKAMISEFCAVLFIDEVLQLYGE